MTGFVRNYSNISIFLFAVTVCHTIIGVYGNYLPTPEFVWSVPILSSNDTNARNEEIFLQGNAIVPIQDENDEKLIITTSTGILHIVTIMNNNNNNNTKNASNISTKSYTPVPLEGKDGITCQGGIISTIESNDDTNRSHIILYAIVDSDSQMGLSSTSSRILAIHSVSAKLVWNITVPGTIIGTPTISKNNRLYVVHNVLSTTSTDPNTIIPEGRVSIYNVNYKNIFSTSGRPTLVTSLPKETTGRPFGPATVVTDNNNKDYVFVAENTFEYSGELDVDNLYVISTNDDNTKEFVFATASTVIQSSNIPPTIRVNDTLEVFLGQPGTVLYGWVDAEADALLSGLVGSSTTSGVPSWRIQLQSDNTDTVSSLPNSPLLSDDNAFLYFTAESEIRALNLEQRSTEWTVTDLGSTVLAKAIYDNQQPIVAAVNASSPVIYFIENEGGILRQYDARTGVINWIVDCTVGTTTVDNNNRPDQCANVASDFAISGNMLYYIDLVGNLIAIKVATFVQVVPTSPPTIPPTKAPVVAPTNVPIIQSSPTISPITFMPSEIPVATISPTSSLDSDENTVDNNKSNSKSWIQENTLIVILCAVCGCLLLLIAIAVCLFRKKSRKNNGVNRNVPDAKVPTDSMDNTDLDESTVVMTPDKNLHDILNITGSTPNSMPSIEECSIIEECSVDEEEHNISNELHVVNDVKHTGKTIPDENFSQNLDEKFTMISFDMEEGLIVQSIEESLSRSSSAQSGRAMLDAYSLASKDKDEVVSQSGSASVTSKGSGRSMKDTVFAAITKSLLPQREKDVDTNPLEVTIPREETMDIIFDQSKNITYFKPVVSPIPSPRPDYLEPGKIRPGLIDSSTGAVSPTGSLLSYDGSLYMDESTIASLEMPLNENLLKNLRGDALAGSETIAELPSDCPEDEQNNKLQPGLVYLNRHQAKKDQYVEPKRSLLLDDTKRTQPMYNGVSVRPAGRSRAGIFSRRQPKLPTQDEDNTDDDINSPENTPEPVVLRTRRTLAQPKNDLMDTPLSPLAANESDFSSPPTTPPPRFTSAGYYVEEPEPDDSLLHDTTLDDEESNASTSEKKLEEGALAGTSREQNSTKPDVWNSFLTELSKAENQFFNPTLNRKKGRSDKHNTGKDQASRPLQSSFKARPAAPSDLLPVAPPDIDDSDDDELLPPPPAPRTFYA